ncbi:MAG: Ribbon-helix-helix protein, CopG family [Candidatus Woesebacteria bacterium GW2011_GWC2_33_12]|uniref:Ribbon-helix-helix protein, CopG family n=1 Tax=Candidatus Woesebacteria bacterium GW2011_GWB1_33_22 TaxID=1618566 RepID=A0A0G0CNG3_9BACT|nr:MAG: Ribbon-helix-helix protein, CopG family [Candidatus Woesebacteria bacterium GW2011_GWC2_33_12]KKP42213.1 MAG: Ribbon-helix-helix protein, CopG family [Candidatus Woesebacteria bacterium GW2011_GWA2_33_20]KKP44947.1 MAG: Ribbon-helix-helix protein, CopG family [Candidatus Woesebacteria bacterium GW2011_GWB1_33_22]KKP46761.1 MAG: Ribbon-helix-helix protein, CopG family [Microgenomates group bacterium GW2011_GWC1_33_28]KKP50661.1 MAG: Ribbon-helix-helix protein, CopG family [Candidatus Woe
MYMLTQTFNISLPNDLVKKADLVAKKEYRNRSELIKEALRTYLFNKLSWEELFVYGKRMGKKMGISSEQDIFEKLNNYRDGR